jgi:hypothetical protein
LLRIQSHSRFSRKQKKELRLGQLRASMPLTTQQIDLPMTLSSEEFCHANLHSSSRDRDDLLY